MPNHCVIKHVVGMCVSYLSAAYVLIKTFLQIIVGHIFLKRDTMNKILFKKKLSV